MTRKSLLFGAVAVAGVLGSAGIVGQQAGQQQQQQQTGQQQAGAQPPQGGGRQGGTPSMGGGDCSRNPYNCPNAANPLPAANTVWLEEMTWMDVRDALKAGKTTVIIATGGIEPNGPWLALGKHNYVNRANCDAIARKLGNALCAPLVPFVPEGNYDTKSSHMASPGTISMTEATFAALLTDIVKSLKAHGFTHIVMIGDSGGNQRGQQNVATALNAEWNGSPLVSHIPQYYTYSAVSKEMASRGLVTEGQSDNLHDDPIISLNMFITDPKSIRFDERVKAGKATINGVSLADAKKNMEMAKAIVEFRATVTADAIKAAAAAKK
jgi:creatinine amidohydrolase/Fe(II)-dependent formamide hydrolase-like protein